MSIDIVIPAHNEEHRIGMTLDTYRSRCVGDDARFLVALDQCTDRTSEIVAEHARADDRVEVIEYPKLGKGGVIMETFRRCEADFVGFVDADCATPPNELLRLLDATRAVDGAIASRWHPAAVLPRRRDLSRRVASAGFAALTKLLFQLPYADTQCGAKVLRREVVQGCLPFLSARDLLFDVDLLVVARTLGFSIVEVPTVWVDQEGSRIDAGRDATRMVASSLRLWLHHRLLPVPSPCADTRLASDEVGAWEQRELEDREPGIGHAA